MKTLRTEIRCKTTTQTFIAGANKDKPELRAASIKGVMRYIWRAIQCEGDKNELRRREGALFGSVDGENARKSPLRLQVYETAENKERTKGRCPLLPHRAAGNDSPQRAIKPDTEFVVQVIGGTGESHTNYVQLFVVTCMLIGFGRRGRKGMGSVSIESISGADVHVPTDLESLAAMLNTLSQSAITYDADAACNRITPQYQHTAFEYPYIESIHFFPCRGGKTTDQLLSGLGTVASNHAGCGYTGKINSRYASSMLFSLYSDYGGTNKWVIVSQLKYTKTPLPVDVRPQIIDDLKAVSQ